MKQSRQPSSSSDMKRSEYNPKSFDEELKEIPLFTDIMGMLLKETAIETEAYEHPYYVFDSQIIDPEIKDREIELERQNDQLKTDIEKLNEKIKIREAKQHQDKVKAEAAQICQGIIDFLFSQKPDLSAVIPKPAVPASFTLDKAQLSTKQRAMSIVWERVRERKKQNEEKLQKMESELAELKELKERLQREKARREKEEAFKQYEDYYNKMTLELTKIRQYNAMLEAKIAKIERRNLQAE